MWPFGTDSVTERSNLKLLPITETQLLCLRSFLKLYENRQKQLVVCCRNMEIKTVPSAKRLKYYWAWNKYLNVAKTY